MTFVKTSMCVLFNAKMYKFIMGPTNHRIRSAATHPLTFSAARGRKIRRRTWRSFRFCRSSLQIDKTEDG